MFLFSRLRRRAVVAAVSTVLAAGLAPVASRPPAASASPPGAVPTSAPAAAGAGYWLAGGDGSVYDFGAAAPAGSLAGTRLAYPVAGMAPTPSGGGYWLVGSDGGVFSFGDARFFGSTGSLRLNQPIVGMAATPTGAGYWFVAADGGIFAFGDAAFYGSTGATKLNKPIVGMAPTPTGRGYWFVASDGGIFAFGDAGFSGSTGATRLNKPIVGLAPTPTGRGYWFVASDGGIFAFGDAGFSGSTGGTPLRRPIVGMAATPTGRGYWFVASDGGIFNFGDAPFLGSAGGRALPAGVVVMSAMPRTGLSGAGGPTPEPPLGTVTPGSTTVTTGPTSPTTATPAPTTTTATITATTTTTTTGGPPGGRAFQIGLVGDTGYSAAQLATFDRVVADMNRFPLAFVTHDGDFKDPPSACTEDVFSAARASFDRSRAPLVYTPGDNEWMDCDNADNAAPADAAGRLDELREMFFPADESRGANRMALATQRQAGFPENARWSREGVVFATLNAPGPNDHYPDRGESGPRRVANRAWLQAAFDTAAATDAPAVMIIWQADPWYVSPGGIDFSPTWRYLTDVLAERAASFGKPVVLVHGDSHVYRVDRPLPGVPNLTRVETHALADSVNWIRVTVDPESPSVFTFADEHARS